MNEIRGSFQRNAISSMAVAFVIICICVLSTARASESAKSIYDSQKSESALQQLIALAKSGDADAAYFVGKTYHDNMTKADNAVPNALFWLLYAYRIGNAEALLLLQEYSRAGYKGYMRLIGSRIGDEIDLRSRDHNSAQFPNATLAEFSSYWRPLFNWRTSEEIRANSLNELSEMKDVEVCREALNIKLSGWDENYYSAPSVEEASRRKLTVEACKVALSQSAFPN